MMGLQGVDLGLGKKRGCLDRRDKGHGFFEQSATATIDKERYWRGNIGLLPLFATLALDLAASKAGSRELR